MKDTHTNSNSKISLEQLLHVKRAERPDPSFWSDFDQELRRRQLATLVAIQPWYVKLGNASLFALRKTAPAAAVLVAAALGIIAYNEQSTTSDSEPAAATVADTSTDTPFVVLPEEKFRFSSDALTNGEPVRVAGVMAERTPRFAIFELNFSDSQPRAYTTVTSPHAFAAAANDSGMYVVNDLTTGPVMRIPASPAGNL